MADTGEVQRRTSLISLRREIGISLRREIGMCPAEVHFFFFFSAHLC